MNRSKHHFTRSIRRGLGDEPSRGESQSQVDQSSPGRGGLEPGRVGGLDHLEQSRLGPTRLARHQEAARVHRHPEAVRGLELEVVEEPVAASSQPERGAVDEREGVCGE